MFEEAELRKCKEETIRECLVRKFKVDDIDGIDWYVRSVADSLISIKDDELAKIIISDFYLLFMKMNLQKSSEAKKDSIKLEAINDVLDSTMSRINAIMMK